MNANFIKERKKALEKQKRSLEEQLSSFARKSKSLNGGWEALYPDFKGGCIEEEADEGEEYDKRVSLEKMMAEELDKVNLALKKIKEARYGICEKCGKLISKERLIVYPQARYCKECNK